MNKVLIVGAGAMGSLFGALLYRKGFNVTLFNRENSHMKHIREEGLTLIDKTNKSDTYDLLSIAKQEDLDRDYDLVIVLLKTFVTEKVLTPLKYNVKNDTVILSLQNGVGNKEVLKKIFPEHTILIGGTGYGSTKLDDGVIAQRGFGTTFIGATDDKLETEKACHKVCEIFNKGEIDTVVSNNVSSVIWSKLIVNVAYNALTALTRLKNGDSIKIDEGKKIVKYLVVEAIQVANAKGIQLLYDNPLEEVIGMGEQQIGENTSSMLTDVLNKRKTEIDSINGAIVMYGNELGMDTPYNLLITQLIKVMEQSYSKMLKE